MDENTSHKRIFVIESNANECRFARTSRTHTHTHQVYFYKNARSNLLGCLHVWSVRHFRLRSLNAHNFPL